MAPVEESEAAFSWPANVNEVPKEAFVREDFYEHELKRIFYGE